MRTETSYGAHRERERGGDEAHREKAQIVSLQFPFRECEGTLFYVYTIS